MLSELGGCQGPSYSSVVLTFRGEDVMERIPPVPGPTLRGMFWTGFVREASCNGFGAMGGTKPYELIGFGAMDVTMVLPP